MTSTVTPFTVLQNRHGRDISRGIISRQKSGRDRDRGGLPDFSRNRDRDRGGLSKKSGRGHRDFIREESRQVGIIREVGGKRDYLDFSRILELSRLFLSG